MLLIYCPMASLLQQLCCAVALFQVPFALFQVPFFLAASRIYDQLFNFWVSLNFAGIFCFVLIMPSLLYSFITYIILCFTLMFVLFCALTRSMYSEICIQRCCISCYYVWRMSYCYLPKPPICVSLDTMFWWSSWCVATTHAQLSAVKSSTRSCIDSLSSFIPRHSHTMWCFRSGLKARVPGDMARVIATKLESARRMVAWLLARKFAYWNHIEINIQDSHVKPDAATLAWMSSGITSKLYTCLQILKHTQY